MSIHNLPVHFRRPNRPFEHLTCQMESARIGLRRYLAADVLHDDRQCLHRHVPFPQPLFGRSQIVYSSLKDYFQLVHVILSTGASSTGASASVADVRRRQRRRTSFAADQRQRARPVGWARPLQLTDRWTSRVRLQLKPRTGRCHRFGLRRVTSGCCCCCGCYLTSQAHSSKQR